jgi:hypothetical protein
MLDNCCKCASDCRRREFLIGSLLAAELVYSIASRELVIPQGEFAVFSECPSTSRESVVLVYCNTSTTQTGEVVIGKTKVPLNVNSNGNEIAGGSTVSQQDGLIEAKAIFEYATWKNHFTVTRTQCPIGQTEKITDAQRLGSEHHEIHQPIPPGVKHGNRLFECSTGGDG